ncbi:MAG: hypothetical protein KGZ96_12910 [Clostridia bacterium]|jgi:hypothetical protein|nr:hypothetical protein [Clostridia bacterium]
MVNRFDLPDSLKGRSLNNKVIPTVCQLKNMLLKLLEVQGDYTKLKQWEKRSYTAYNIEDIKLTILNSCICQLKIPPYIHLKIPHL